MPRHAPFLAPVLRMGMYWLRLLASHVFEGAPLGDPDECKDALRGVVSDMQVVIDQLGAGHRAVLEQSGVYHQWRFKIEFLFHV
eukprot:8215255-Alexandrium_andersonii.AAC.1